MIAVASAGVGLVIGRSCAGYSSTDHPTLLTHLRLGLHPCKFTVLVKNDFSCNRSVSTPTQFRSLLGEGHQCVNR